MRVTRLMAAPVWTDLRTNTATPKAAPVTPVSMAQPIRYVGDPAPTPAPAPPAPAPAKTSWMTWVTTILSLVLPFVLANWKYIALLLWGTVMTAKVMGPSIEADSSSVLSWMFPGEAARAGQNFRYDLGAAAKSASYKFADVIDSGGTIEAAETALETEFQSARTTAFAQKYAKVFTAVIPSGQEPTTPAERTAYSKKWRRFGDGAEQKRIFGGW